MKLVQQITEQVNLINEVLVNVNQSALLENSNFLIDEMSSERYLKVKYDSLGHISFTIVLTPLGIQVDVDRAIEAYDVGIEYFNNNKTEFKNLIKMLFTSRIKVEYCGSNYTKIYFYDVSGSQVKTFKYVTGLYLKVGCKIKEYHPIYTIE